VDGVLAAKNFYDCSYESYHSLTSSGAYWQVDLGSSQTISKVVYYNRGDLNMNTRATTNTLTLLNNANKTICMCNSFTSDLIQDLPLTLGIIMSHGDKILSVHLLAYSYIIIVSLKMQN